MIWLSKTSQSLIEKLESIGFLSLFSRRIGPCAYCEEVLQTFYLPELKLWLCEECYYHDSENGAFINELALHSSGKNMATNLEAQFKALQERLDKVEAENAQLKSSREDNVFVGSSDNLTLKSRAINPKAWGVPTKAQSGQAYFRCSDFPFSFDVAKNQAGHLVVRCYSEIPVDERQAQLFTNRFINQMQVTAKRRQTAEETKAGTPTIPGASTATTPPQASAPAGPRSFSSLTKPEQDSLIAEATKLSSIPGLFPDLKSALMSVIQPKNISLP